MSAPLEPTAERGAPEPVDAAPSSIVDVFDAVVDAWFDHLRGNAVVDRVMYTASELADFSLLWHFLGTAQGLVRPDGFERAARVSAALGVESVLVNGVLKSAFRRSRPVPTFERPHKLRQPRTTSFPSGHASSAFLAAALLSEGSRAKPVYVTLAAVVAASRVHVRIHHASDVLGGVAVGVALGAATKRLWPAGGWPMRPRRR
jgi:undecaprenyl-diphosphatase